LEKLKNIRPRRTQKTRKKQKQNILFFLFFFQVGLHKARCRQYQSKRREQQSLIPAYKPIIVFDFFASFAFFADDDFSL